MSTQVALIHQLFYSYRFTCWEERSYDKQTKYGPAQTKMYYVDLSILVFNDLLQPVLQIAKV
jgi:hypothetical protein